MVTIVMLGLVLADRRSSTRLSGWTLSARRLAASAAASPGGGLAHVPLERLRQRERQRLLGGGHLGHLVEAALGQVVEHLHHQVVGHAGAGGEADGRRALEPLVLRSRGRSRPGTTRGRRRSTATSASRTEFDEFREPDDDHHVALRRDLLDHVLPVGGGVADVVARRRLQQRQPLLESGHRLHRLVHRQRGLGQPDDLVRVADGDLVDAVRAVDQLDVGGRLAGRTDDLFVPFVTDEQNVVVVRGEPLRLLVHLRHQRAGRVDGLAGCAGPGLLVHLGRHAVGREDHDRALGHLVVLLDEDRALRLQAW